MRSAPVRAAASAKAMGEIMRTSLQAIAHSVNTASDYPKQVPTSRIGAMDAQTFAREFGRLFREVYLCAVREVDDARDRLAPETAALLLHVAQAGPATLTELALHLDRSLSTLSAKIASLETAGLLARQRDEQDGRRTLIWLSPAGRAALEESLQVLDAARLAQATARWDAGRRQRLVDELRSLADALASSRHHHHGDPP
jgi:DNA-binding MarR family transcriptional regulator